MIPQNEIAVTPKGGVAAMLSPATLGAFDKAVVGRRTETEVLLAALAAGRHVMLEGPPGTGKSTLLRTLATAAGVSLVFVEGSAELTPGRLVGSHDPSRVLAEGYRDENFLDGPLLQAMRSGGLLYLEELNRVPEETINVLITVMSEGELHVPRLGLVRSVPGFALVAAMNPFDAVGTARISAAVYDRTCRIRMDYQSAPDEEQVVERAVRSTPASSGGAPAMDASRSVALVRATRDHPEIRIGSSVRGAIDMMLVADRLARLRALPPDDPGVSLDASLAALTGRIRVQEGGERSAEEIITELWHRVYDPPAETERPDDPGKAAGATGRDRPAPLAPR
ncbi:MAG: MoxR family ATPase [Rhodoglobus sp.]